MTKAEIKHTQERVGTLPDGFWGPKSTAACQLYLKALMPNPHPFPTYSQIKTGRTKFGKPCWPGSGSYETRKIRLPFQMYLYGNRSDVVRSISVNVACADEMQESLAMIRDLYTTDDERYDVGVSKYFGVRACRPVRGGSSPSNHAWASAIDLDANRNRNRAHWPVASKMPIEVMECFAATGFKPAGAFWNRDGMHFEATR